MRHGKDLDRASRIVYAINDAVGAAARRVTSLQLEAQRLTRRGGLVAIVSSVSMTAAASEMGRRSIWRRAGGITSTSRGASLTQQRWAVLEPDTKLGKGRGLCPFLECLFALVDLRHGRRVAGRAGSLTIRRTSYSWGVQRLFDVDWQDLDIEHVESFLAEAGDEGLTWEGKGEREPHRDSVRKAVCGFANAVGGYLIIGAERSEGRWHVPGVSFRHDEPGTWLASLVAAQGVTPVPVFDVKVFDRADGRHAAVIAVEPLEAPPCITASGVVYQRVSGQTLPVTDQRVMSELLQKGMATRHNAEALAVKAAERLLTEPTTFEPSDSLFAAGLSAISGPADKAAVLFSKEFSDAFSSLVAEHLQLDPLVRHSVHGSIHQDCLRAWPASGELRPGMMAAAFWDGAASVVGSFTGSELSMTALVQDVRRARQALSAIVGALGGYGEAHLAVLINGKHPAVAHAGRDTPRTAIQRWTEVREATKDELGSITRELVRGFGREIWEP